MYKHIILMINFNKIKNDIQQDNLNRQITMNTRVNDYKQQSINQSTLQYTLPQSQRAEVAITTPYLFDWKYYLEKYPDLRMNGVNTEHQALTHWHSCGEKEERVAIRTPYLFDWQYYLEKYPDLRKNGVNTEHQAIIHWQTMGEKEKRVAIRTPYLFDWQYYLEKYPDLRKNCVNTEHQALTHWYNFGEKEQRVAIITPELFDWTHYLEKYPNLQIPLINNRYLNKCINTNISLDGTPIRIINTYSELVLLYKINSLPYYINSLESFYILYPDFDLNYYKQKYYNQTTLSDIKIMYDFHTINEYKKRLYNDKIKIVIYTPHLYEKCGGIKSLHYLAQKINNLNKKKLYAKLYCYDGSKYVNNYCNDFANPFEINENTIVIYPEIVKGNPLNAKYVVRWILLELGIEMPKIHYLNWNKSDIVYHWEPNSAKTNQQLAVPFLDEQFKNFNNSKRTKTCFLIKKGPLIHDNIKYFHPPDAIKIDNMDLNDIVKIFNESHTFYCYDPNSFYLISATVCGCISVIYPIKHISSDIYFKNRITYIDNVVFNAGIAYGNSTEQLTHARNTLSDVSKNINILLAKYEANVSKFTEDMYDYLTQNKNLITIEKEYY